MNLLGRIQYVFLECTSTLSREDFKDILVLGLKRYFDFTCNGIDVLKGCFLYKKEQFAKDGTYITDL